MRKDTLYGALLGETASADLDWNRLRGARVMITGASGLIGSFLTDLLMAYNVHHAGQISVAACVRNPDAARTRFSAHSDNPNFRLVQYDVTKPYSDADEYDFILHTASNASPAVFSTDPVGTMTGLVEGTKNVLELASACRAKRVLVVSTGEIYGRGAPEDLPFREDFLGWIDVLSPRSCYPSGKRAAETLCAAYGQQYGVDSVIARPCHVYGPTATPRDNRASTQFLNDAAAGRDIVMKSPGLQLRSYLHVADCALALLYVLIHGAPHQAYNVASPLSVLTIAEFAEKCAKAGGARVVFELPDELERRGYAPVQPQTLDTAKLQSLGFTARFAPDEGILNAVDILRENLSAG
jgi:nucleoside-diphosphate-sugar epimerase